MWWGIVGVSVRKLEWSVISLLCLFSQMHTQLLDWPRNWRWRIVLRMALRLFDSHHS
jgi:hypothetical protein